MPVSPQQMYFKIEDPILVKKLKSGLGNIFMLFLCHNFLECLIFKRIFTKTSKIVDLFCQRFYFYATIFGKMESKGIIFRKFGNLFCRSRS